MKSKNMRTISIICAALIIFAAFGGCAAKEEIIHPPQRVGDGGGTSFMWAYEPSLSNLLEKSDLIAHVTIGNWLEETENGTLFEVKVNKVYKGENTDTIIYAQPGNSSINEGPLFDYGNELLLFLRVYDMDECPEDSVYAKYDNLSASLFANHVVCDITSINGKLYFNDRWGFITNDSESELNLQNYATEIKGIMRRNLEKQDSFRAEQPVIFGGYEYIYSLEEFESLISD